MLWADLLDTKQTHIFKPVEFWTTVQIEHVELFHQLQLVIMEFNHSKVVIFDYTNLKIWFCGLCLDLQVNPISCLLFSDHDGMGAFCYLVVGEFFYQVRIYCILVISLVGNAGLGLGAWYA